MARRDRESDEPAGALFADIEAMDREERNTLVKTYMQPRSVPESFKESMLVSGWMLVKEPKNALFRKPDKKKGEETDDPAVHELKLRYALEYYNLVATGRVQHREVDLKQADDVEALWMGRNGVFPLDGRKLVEKKTEIPRAWWSNDVYSFFPPCVLLEETQRLIACFLDNNRWFGGAVVVSYQARFMLSVTFGGRLMHLANSNGRHGRTCHGVNVILIHPRAATTRQLGRETSIGYSGRNELEYDESMDKTKYGIPFVSYPGTRCGVEALGTLGQSSEMMNNDLNRITDRAADKNVGDGPKNKAARRLSVATIPTPATQPPVLLDCLASQQSASSTSRHRDMLEELDKDDEEEMVVEESCEAISVGSSDASEDLVNDSDIGECPREWTHQYADRGHFTERSAWSFIRRGDIAERTAKDMVVERIEPRLLGKCRARLDALEESERASIRSSRATKSTLPLNVAAASSVVPAPARSVETVRSAPPPPTQVQPAVLVVASVQQQISPPIQQTPSAMVPQTTEPNPLLGADHAMDDDLYADDPSTAADCQQLVEFAQQAAAAPVTVRSVPPVVEPAQYQPAVVMAAESAQQPQSAQQVVPTESVHPVVMVEQTDRSRMQLVVEATPAQPIPPQVPAGPQTQQENTVSRKQLRKLLQCVIDNILPESGSCIVDFFERGITFEPSNKVIVLAKTTTCKRAFSIAYHEGSSLYQALTDVAMQIAAGCEEDSIRINFDSAGKSLQFWKGSVYCCSTGWKEIVTDGDQISGEMPDYPTVHKCCATLLNEMTNVVLEEVLAGKAATISYALRINAEVDGDYAELQLVCDINGQKRHRCLGRFDTAKFVFPDRSCEWTGDAITGAEFTAFRCEGPAIIRYDSNTNAWQIFTKTEIAGVVMYKAMAGKTLKNTTSRKRAQPGV